MTTALRRLKALAGAPFLAMAACGLLGIFGDGKPTRPFSHAKHGPDQELECANCHSTAEKADEAGMPTSLKRCMLCHEGRDEEQSPERKLAALVGEKPEWTHVTALPDEVAFSHQKHHAANVACADCHAGIAANTSIDDSARVSKDACMNCHARRGKPNDCSVCHKTITQDTPPPSHLRNWKQVHGGIVRSGENPPYSNRCSLCHAPSSCTSCHQDEAPRSHTNFWRIQGHAVAADVDRSACATCHRSDFCDRCHRDTAPRSHTASWGDPQDRHCLSCHTESGPSRPCITCHVGARHETAPPRPANAQHAGATDNQCRTCHLVIGMPHPDNGDRCGSCH